MDCFTLEMFLILIYFMEYFTIIRQSLIVQSQAFIQISIYQNRI